MPKSKTTDLSFANISIYGGGFVGGLISLGYTLYGLYQFLPVWFDSLLAFALLTPFVIFFAGLTILVGLWVGFLAGLCLYLICTGSLALFAILSKMCGWLLSKHNKTATHNKVSKHTNITKETIELITGLVTISYTLALVVVAIFSDIPTDALIVIWLMLSVITSCLGNRQIKRINT